MSSLSGVRSDGSGAKRSRAHIFTVSTKGNAKYHANSDKDVSSSKPTENPLKNYHLRYVIIAASSTSWKFARTFLTCPTSRRREWCGVSDYATAVSTEVML